MGRRLGLRGCGGAAQRPGAQPPPRRKGKLRARLGCVNTGEPRGRRKKCAVHVPSPDPHDLYVDFSYQKRRA